MQRVPAVEAGPASEDEVNCPYCGHTDDDHRRESWFDDEGVEGMTCEIDGCDCAWMTWDWSEVVQGKAQSWGR